MLKRFLVILSVVYFVIVFNSCDISQKIKESEKDISVLKEEMRLVKESVSNYENTVNGMGKEMNYLKKEVADLKQKKIVKPKTTVRTSRTRARR